MNDGSTPRAGANTEPRKEFDATYDLEDCAHDWHAVSASMNQYGQWVVLEQCAACKEYREKEVEPTERVADGELEGGDAEP